MGRVKFPSVFRTGDEVTYSMEQFKGTAENPFTIEEFQDALISDEDLITITIIANRKSKTVRVIDEGTNREELKSIIADVMRQINSRSF